MRTVMIKFKDGMWEVTPDPVHVPPLEIIRWRAKDSDIAPHTGFRVDFHSSPSGGTVSYPSVPDGNHHVAISDAVNNFGRFKYSITLLPDGPTLDPEVRVEDPAMNQAFCSAFIEINGGVAIYDDVTVYEGDLLRFVIDSDQALAEDLRVAFLTGMPVYSPTTHARDDLRVAPITKMTFYCQVRPVEKERSNPYTYQLAGFKASGEGGKITVLPRPEPKSAQ